MNNTMRTPDEINTEFAQLTLALGHNTLEMEDLYNKRVALSKTREKILKRVEELTKEMAIAQKEKRENNENN